MAYITQTQLEQRWPSVAVWSDDAAVGAADADVVAEIIALAEGEIDRAAGQHYVTPLGLSDSRTAATIRDVAAVLAGWKLASRAKDAAALEAMDREYTEARAFLDRLRAGREELVGETQRQRTTPSGAPVIKTDEGQMTPTNMRGW